MASRRGQLRIRGGRKWVGAEGVRFLGRWGPVRLCLPERRFSVDSDPISRSLSQACPGAEAVRWWVSVEGFGRAWAPAFRASSELRSPGGWAACEGGGQRPGEAGAAGRPGRPAGLCWWSCPGLIAVSGPQGSEMGLPGVPGVRMKPAQCGQRCARALRLPCGIWAKVS